MRTMTRPHPLAHDSLLSHLHTGHTSAQAFRCGLRLANVHRTALAPATMVAPAATEVLKAVSEQ